MFLFKNIRVVDEGIVRRLAQDVSDLLFSIGRLNKGALYSLEKSFVKDFCPSAGVSASSDSSAALDVRPAWRSRATSCHCRAMSIR